MLGKLERDRRVKFTSIHELIGQRSNACHGFSTDNWIHVVCWMNQDVADANGTQHLDGRVDPGEIIERRAGAAEQLLQCRSISAVTIHDGMVMEECRELIRQRRRDVPRPNRELQHSALRALREPLIEKPVGRAAVGIQVGESNGRGPALGNDGDRQRRSCHGRSDSRQIRQDPGGPDRSQHTQREKDHNREPGRRAQPIKAGNDARKPQIGSHGKEPSPPGGGLRAQRKNERKQPNQRVAPGEVLAIGLHLSWLRSSSARPKGDSREDECDNSREKLSLRCQVPGKPRPPQSNSLANMNVRAQIGREIDEITIRPPKSIHPPHVEIRQRHGRHCHNDRSGGSHKRANDARPVLRELFAPRDKFGDHNHARRESQKVQEVPV